MPPLGISPEDFNRARCTPVSIVEWPLKQRTSQRWKKIRRKWTRNFLRGTGLRQTQGAYCLWGGICSGDIRGVYLAYMNAYWVGKNERWEKRWSLLGKKYLKGRARSGKIALRQWVSQSCRAGGCPVRRPKKLARSILGVTATFRNTTTNRTLNLRKAQSCLRVFLPFFCPVA